MWARRCGAGPRWPSRVRVMIQSFLTGTIGFVVYDTMANLNINHLDIQMSTDMRPAEQLRSSNRQVICLSEWPQRNHPSLLQAWSPVTWTVWWKYQTDTQQYREEHQCDASVEEVTHWQSQNCNDLTIPLQRLTPWLGFPMGGNASLENDVLYLYANLFMIFAFSSWLAFLVHDLALLHPRQKNFVLDWTGMNQSFPVLGTFPGLTGLPMAVDIITGAMKNLKHPGNILSLLCGVICFLIAIVWAVFFYCFFVVPFVVILFTIYPIRLSRFWIFILMVTLAIYGLCLFFHQIFFLVHPEERPRYSIVWEAGTGKDCECGCSYVLFDSIHRKLLAISLGVIFQSILSALRVLRGLRRSQWANLMSVMFPVPIGVFSVEWQTPSGDPIKYRNEGEPVQGEAAFDPFALMDEQPESRYTMLTLRPEFAYSVDDHGKVQALGYDRDFQGPELAAVQPGEWQVQSTEYLGCCGFPCLTGGYQAVMPDTSSGSELESGDEGADLDEDGKEPTSVEIDLESGAMDASPTIAQQLDKLKRSYNAEERKKKKLQDKLKDSRWNQALKRRSQFGLLKGRDHELARLLIKGTARDLGATRNDASYNLDDPNINMADLKSLPARRAERKHVSLENLSAYEAALSDPELERAAASSSSSAAAAATSLHGASSSSAAAAAAASTTSQDKLNQSGSLTGIVAAASSSFIEDHAEGGHRCRGSTDRNLEKDPLKADSTGDTKSKKSVAFQRVSRTGSRRTSAGSDTGVGRVDSGASNASSAMRHGLKKQGTSRGTVRGSEVVRAKFMPALTFVRRQGTAENLKENQTTVPRSSDRSSPAHSPEPCEEVELPSIENARNKDA